MMNRRDFLSSAGVLAVGAVIASRVPLDAAPSGTDIGALPPHIRNAIDAFMRDVRCSGATEDDIRSIAPHLTDEQVRGWIADPSPDIRLTDAEQLEELETWLRYLRARIERRWLRRRAARTLRYDTYRNGHEISVSIAPLPARYVSVHMFGVHSVIISDRLSARNRERALALAARHTEGPMEHGAWLPRALQRKDRSAT